MGLFKRRPLPPVLRLMAAAGLPTAGGEIKMPAIAMEVARRDGNRAAACLRVVEDLLAEQGDGPHTALKFLEALQNTTSHGVPELLTAEELLPLRGPLTVAGWAQVERFWNAVIVWCEQNDVDLHKSAPFRTVENQRLRSIVWPSGRTLADGRVVTIAQVVLYEKAVGATMM
ncbi:hypothetical protein AB0B66_24920 [Catellatospora sp. NPDC049111]|uniref:hypothetical protein n=1 Tax=Catellatospora sp. NPDC049111 TaxID=3155271 RepID=UPI00340D8975